MNNLKEVEDAEELKRFGEGIALFGLDVIDMDREELIIAVGFLAKAYERNRDEVKRLERERDTARSFHKLHCKGQMLAVTLCLYGCCIAFCGFML